MKLGALALLLLCGVGAAGCVTGAYGRRSFNEPVSAERLAGLVPGRDDLGSCLRLLGAPVEVHEYRVGADRSSGMALLWYWRDTVGWGLDVSAPISREARASFEFDWAGVATPGVVLWFDHELRLERYRTGNVGELLPQRRRAAPVLDH